MKSMLTLFKFLSFYNHGMDTYRIATDQTGLQNRTIIIPAYNESETIGKLIKNTLPYGEVLVIDDGSNDNTCDEAMRSNGHVLRHSTNKGKGFALRTAFTATESDEIVVMDADGQYDPNDIPKLLKKLKDCDYVIGCRDWTTVPFRHRMGNRVWINLFNSLYGTNLSDVSCGFIAMKKWVYKNLDISGGYVVDVDMISQAGNMGAKVENVPVSVNYRQTSAILRGIGMVAGVSISMIAKRYICKS